MMGFFQLATFDDRMVNPLIYQLEVDLFHHSYRGPMPPNLWRLQSHSYAH